MVVQPVEGLHNASVLVDHGGQVKKLAALSFSWYQFPMGNLFSATHFRKVDEQRNMRRFYSLDAQPTLFGEWCAVQNWGRIGSKGKEKLMYFKSWDEAQAFLTAERLKRRKRGYAAYSDPQISLNIISRPKTPEIDKPQPQQLTAQNP